MTLRAIADDLREVERFLDELAARMAARLAAGDLRHLAVELRTGCAEMAAAIEGALPPAPGTPAGDDSAAGVETGG